MNTETIELNNRVCKIIFVEATLILWPSRLCGNIPKTAPQRTAKYPSNHAQNTGYSLPGKLISQVLCRDPPRHFLTPRLEQIIHGFRLKFDAREQYLCCGRMFKYGEFIAARGEPLAHYLYRYQCTYLECRGST